MTTVSFTTVKALAAEIAARRRIPSATYRLQFNRSFTFRDACALVPYLHDLGISDCYASPILKARAGSGHGYDITDHTRLNPDLGTEADFDAFCAALQAHGMGLILDTVPNHMGIGDPSNGWWTDILENGPSSVYSEYFDIDWHPVKAELENKVLLPILEDQYGKVLESGKLRLAYEDGAFVIYHYQTKLPLAPQSYRDLLGYPLEALRERLGSDHEQVHELQSILTALSYLPEGTVRDPEKVAERNREKEIIKRRIGALCRASPAVQAAIADTVQVFNGTVGEPRSFGLLDALLDQQAYRLAFWRVATEEVNYRRFFDINDLAAIRTEVPEVFQATHQLLFRLLTEGKVTGLRIDHPDGLWNPPGYLRALQESYILHLVRARMDAEATERGMALDAAAWVSTILGLVNGAAAASWPLYVVAEKILSKGEPLPESWAVYGTTGYEFANALNGIFVDSGNRKAVDAVYTRFIRRRMDFRQLVNATKKMTMLISLASEINMLAHQLNSISEKNRRYRDFTLNSLTFAIREVIACLPVYRTYVMGLGEPVASQDQAYLEAAVAEAKQRNPRTAESIFDFIRDTLLLHNVEDFQEQDRVELGSFVLKFQQVTGPVMAKAVEDTAFYVYNRLVSLNEVGGDPEQFGISVAAFHRQNTERRRRWPHSLLATSTHDTKRSEDVRARISVLSELPGEWRAALTRWSRLNRRKKTMVDGQPAPDRNDEYLFYQTLLGAWPADPQTPQELAGLRERLAAYMLKATREAKVHTSWINPNEHYDAAVRDFVLHTLAEGNEDPFLEDFRGLQRRVSYFGQFNALAQALLKLTCPGVPDLYQGSELWDLRLVDPDNRRPVDYARRCSLLAELQARTGGVAPGREDLARELLEASDDGGIKLYVTYRALRFRRRYADLFASGAYVPLETSGARREHVCAFARTHGDVAAVVVVPRLVVRLTGGAEQPPLGEAVWKDTWLTLPHDKPGSRYREVFSGAELIVVESGGASGLSLAEVCAHFPVALLERLGDAHEE